MFAQKDAVNIRNGLKLDLLGPTKSLFYSYPDTRIRASLEYERRLTKHFSMSADLEWDLRQYSSYRLFVWPPSYLFDPEYMTAYVTQTQAALLFGGRYVNWLDSVKDKYYLFGEGRIGCQYRHAHLSPESISRSPLDVDKFAFIGRARIGIGWYFLKSFGLEASLDASRYHFMGSGKKVLQPVIEINLTYRF
ncbi:MAG: hypothetical protein U0176_02465 [Bacteroidia bacterium]